MKSAREYKTDIKFEMGDMVVTTPGFRDNSTGEDNIFQHLVDHLTLKQGELCDEDQKENEFSAQKGFRILTVHRLKNETKFYIITEADRSTTTLLLPSEY